jgi:DNA-binding HxlR family transcriptional regulator
MIERGGDIDLGSRPAESGQAPLTAFCPTFASLMDLVSRRWMGIILRVLTTGPHRFSEILAAVPGLSDPLLTQRLRELEAHKILVRRVIATSPVKVEYELTESGRDLERPLRAFADWAEKWMIEGPVADAFQAAATSAAGTAPVSASPVSAPPVNPPDQRPYGSNSTSPKLSSASTTTG